ncbi:MAG: hypothetical protein WBW57_21030, partial [Candidatus Sulfotelmatobacter sp.]
PLSVLGADGISISRLSDWTAYPQLTQYETPMSEIEILRQLRFDQRPDTFQSECYPFICAFEGTFAKHHHSDI